jgi:hypothetical protein
VQLHAVIICDFHRPDVFRFAAVQMSTSLVLRNLNSFSPALDQGPHSAHTTHTARNSDQSSVFKSHCISHAAANAAAKRFSPARPCFCAAPVLDCSGSDRVRAGTSTFTPPEIYRKKGFSKFKKTFCLNSKNNR